MGVLVFENSISTLGSITFIRGEIVQGLWTSSLLVMVVVEPAWTNFTNMLMVEMVKRHLYLGIGRSDRT